MKTIVILILALSALAGSYGVVTVRAQLPVPEPAVQEASIQEVVIRTRDHAFEAPEEIRSGPTHLRLVNEGPDFHHVWLVRLSDGKTAEDLSLHLAAGNHEMPSWAVDVGGPNTPGRPGEETSVYLNLTPGDYAMMDVIPDGTDGVLHVSKGMIRDIRVTGRADGNGRLPEADLEMVLDDYSFGLSRAVTPGRHLIRVTNQADQAHEVVIVRLHEGKTAGDYLQWIGSREGSEPGRMLGGVTGLARGEFNVVPVEFEPGPYALLCFVPDATTGQPHFMHGMIQEFVVR